MVDLLEVLLNLAILSAMKREERIRTYQLANCEYKHQDYCAEFTLQLSRKITMTELSEERGAENWFADVYLIPDHHETECGAVSFKQDISVGN